MSNSFSLVLSASSLLLKQIKQHTKEVITLSLDYKLVTIAAVMKTVLNRKRHEDLCGNIFVFCFSLSRVWSFYKSDGGTNRNDNLPLKLSTDSSAVPSHIHGFLYRQLENSTCITDVQISNAVHVRKGLGRVIKMSFLFLADKMRNSTVCHIQSHEGRDQKKPHHNPADNNMTVYRELESLIAVCEGPIELSACVCLCLCLCQCVELWARQTDGGIQIEDKWPGRG